jgi:hypothetical protein
MRLSPTVRSRPHALQPVLEGARNQSAQAGACGAGVGPDLPDHTDGQLDGEHHGGVWHRQPLGMLLCPVDIPSGLPQGHLVTADKHPQDGRHGKVSQQGQRAIDPLRVLAGLGPPASTHGT